MAVAFIASSTATGVGTTALSFTSVAANETAGCVNILVTAVRSAAGAAFISGVSGAGGVWTQIGIERNSTPTVVVQMWMSPPLTSAGTVTCTVNGTATETAAAIASYSGVSNVIPPQAVANGSSTSESVSRTIQYANSFVVAGFGVAYAETATITTGTLRVATNTGTTATGIGIALNDNTAASGAVANTNALANSASWGACAVELTATAATGINLIPGSQATGTGTTALTLTSLILDESATVILCTAVRSAAGAANISGVSGAGGTWKQIGSQSNVTPTVVMQMWVGTGLTSAATVTCTVSGTSTETAAILEAFSGVGVVTGNQASSDPTASVNLTQALTTKNANSWVVCGFGDAQATALLTVTGMTWGQVTAGAGATGVLAALSGNTAVAVGTSVTNAATATNSAAWAALAVELSPVWVAADEEDENGYGAVFLVKQAITEANAASAQAAFDAARDQIDNQDPDEYPAGDLLTGGFDADNQWGGPTWLRAPFVDPGSIYQRLGVSLIDPEEISAGYLTPGIAFDATGGNSGGANGNTIASLTITATIVPGETGIVAMTLYKTATGVPNYITSIVGGGTWNQIGAFDDGTAGHVRVELWTNGAGGGSAASSVTINFNQSSGTVGAAVLGQYQNVGQVLVSGQTTNSGSGTTASVGETTTQPASFVVAGLGSIDNSTNATQVTGNLRATTFNGTHGAVALSDNTGYLGSTVSNAVSFTSGAWGAIAVELSPAQVFFPSDDQDIWSSQPRFPVPPLVWTAPSLVLPVLLDPEEIPAGKLVSQMDEVYPWPPPPPPPPPPPVVPFTEADTDWPTPPSGSFVPDEDFPWPMLPAAAITAPPVVIVEQDQDWPTPPVAFAPDEDFVVIPAPAQPAPPPPLVLATDEIQRLDTDEDYGSPLPPPWPAVAPSPPAQARLDPDELTAGALVSQLDEVYWTAPPPAPFVSPPVLLPVDADDRVAPPAGFSPDEDFGAPLPPAPGQPALPPVQALASTDEIQQLDTDEDFWVSGVAPVPASLALLQPFPALQDETELLGFDEEPWNVQQPIPVVVPPVQATTGTDEIERIGVDEEPWNVTQPQPVVVPAPLILDASETVPTPMLHADDGDLWRLLASGIPVPAYVVGWWLLQDAEVEVVPTAIPLVQVIVSAPFSIIQAAVQAVDLGPAQVTVAPPFSVVEIAVTPTDAITAAVMPFSIVEISVTTLSEEPTMYLGDVVQIPVTFQNLGVPFDPATFTLTITGTNIPNPIAVPQGSCTRTGVGLYYYNWTALYVGNVVAVYQSTQAGLTGTGVARFEILPVPLT